MATHPNAWSPAEAWRRFRLEAEAAKNYPLSYSMYIGQTHRDVLLERLLPSLLYIKADALSPIDIVPFARRDWPFVFDG
jgi:hypothetical protein